MKQEIENIIYTKNEDFVKYTKKQRLEMPQYDVFDRVEITRLLLIPLNKKYNGYGTGAFFVMNDNGWFRAMDYDCFSIQTDIENPSKLKYTILRGDFEYNGINIFTLIDEHNKAYISYGGTITIIPKNK